jgi:hypothetical protein
MTTKEAVSEHIRTLTKNINAPAKDKLFLAACTIELLRRAQQADKHASQAIVNFLSRVADVPWGKISFSLTQSVLTRGATVAKQYLKDPNNETAVYSVLLEAVAIFADILADSPDDATLEVFDAVVAELADQHNKPIPVVTAPEIFQPRMADRVFKPTPVDDRLCAQFNVAYVLYKSPAGPELRGFAMDTGSSLVHLVLETGEYLALSAENIPLRTMSRPEDYATVPTVLSIYATYLMVLFRQLQQDTSNSNKVDSNCFGAFNADCTVHNVLVDEESVSTLQAVIDKAREAASIGLTGATGPVGASVRFQVPNTDMAVVLDVRVAATGPYVVSRLLQIDPNGTEQILMRHETPRENSLYGIYLFPLKNTTVVLEVI